MVPDADELSRRALRSITIIGIAGVLLIAADLIVSWSPGTIDIVRGDKDQIYLIRPSEDESTGHLSLKAEVQSDRGTYEKNMDLTLSPYREGEDPENSRETVDEKAADEERIMYELRAIASDLDSDRSKRKVLLPSRLPGGGTIRWIHRRQSHTVLLMCLMMASAAVIYRRRLLPLEKKKEEESRSVLDCLPEFIHQMVLLMNAGLVLSLAFSRAVEENIRFRTDENRFFYIKIRQIYESMKNTNGSLTSELSDLAGESGVGELMRISTIIRDNANKGTELVEKLERESASLWNGRKMKMEERGRLAETKMTLPLSIFLGVLILITVSPALIEL